VGQAGSGPSCQTLGRTCETDSVLAALKNKGNRLGPRRRFGAECSTPEHGQPDAMAVELERTFTRKPLHPSSATSRRTWKNALATLPPRRY
jgi:hypothetical protein